MTKKRFEEIGKTIGALVEEKNIAYGDSFSRSQEIIKILYPDGVKPEQYTDMLAITRVIDKLFRIANKKDAFGESPWRDICGYAILGIANDEPARKINKFEELWGEQQEEEPVTYRELLRNPDKYMTDEEQEVMKESIAQGTKDDKPKEGHGNPYANIDKEVDVFDRDVRLSHDNKEEQKITPSTIKFKPSRLGADSGI